MTDSRRELMERVQRVIRELLLIDSLVITEELWLADIPEWDSMLHVTLVMSLEREFAIRLNAKEAGALVAIRPTIDILIVRLLPAGDGESPGG